MKFDTIILFVVAVILLLVTAGCTSEASTATVTTVTPTPNPGTNMSWYGGMLTATHVEDIYDNGVRTKDSKTMTLTGLITNNMKDNTGMFVMTADLYDDNDVKVAWSTTTINDLKPGETALFKIKFYNQDEISTFARYKITID